MALKIGELIVNTHSVPTTNMFAWTLSPDYPFTYGAWLAEALMYLLFRWGGLALIIFTRTFLTVTAFGAMAYEAFRRSGSWRIAALVVMLAGAMSANNTLVRPQMFAWLPFLLYFILLSMFADGHIQRGWLLLCPLAMAFWVNVHGSFVLAGVLTGIFFVGEALRILLHYEDPPSWGDVAWIGLIGVLTLVAAVANPQFIGIFGYVANMMTDQPSQSLIGEWQSPAPENYSMILFFASILLTMFAFAFSRTRPSPTDLLLIAAFTWLAWTGVRYVAWYALVVMPVLAGVLGELVRDKPWMAVPPPNRLNLILAWFVCLPVLFFQPWLVERLPLPTGYTDYAVAGSQAGPLLHYSTPVGAAEYLRQHPGGKLFNENGYGSYLIWAVPEQKVFIDPRVELYPYQQWKDYIKITSGARYNELLSQYGADRILISRIDQKEFSRLLKTDPLWKLEYQDNYSELWARVK